ncbi:MAG: hypothetical protein A3F17_05440 [Gammaproteobacteria bacterium RIFCSPHIGHO2_12_FULL_41_15]|nr:MAG: hypothetical protein A3F17_05440 [Gammaproteobacteria bacterium RIFCSPHIGHO2_12_FULL_41_15]
MKILSPRPKLALITIGILLIVGITLLWSFITPMVTAYRIYVLSWLIILLIIASPLGSYRLGSSTKEYPRYAPLSWLLRIIGIELSLIAVFWGVTYVSGLVSPVLTSPHVALLTQTWKDILLPMGFFPWASIALVSAAFAYHSYCRHQDTDMSTTLYPLLPLKTKDTLSIISNNTVRALTLLILASTLVFMSLLLTSLFVPEHVLMSFTGFHMTSLVVLFILLVSVVNKRFRQKIYTQIVEKKTSPSVVFGFFTLIMALTLIVMLLFFGNLHTTSIKMPHVIQVLFNQGWINNWHLFAILWWLAWIPMVGIDIAYVSRGYTVRAVLITTLIIPLLIGTGLFFIPDASSHPIAIHPILWPILIAASLAGFCYCLVTLASSARFELLARTYLPADRIKYHAQDRFITRLLQTSVLLLYVYLPAGIIGLNILFFIAALIPTVLFLLVPVALLMALWRALHRY